MSTKLPNLPAFAMRVLSKFTHLLDRQTQKGIATYHMTLDQNDGYDELNGALEEAVDGVQYIVRAIERRAARDAVVREVIDALTELADSSEDLNNVAARKITRQVEKLRGTLTPEKREGAGE